VVEIRSPDRGPFRGGAAEWNVSLPRGVTLQTAVTLNAGEGHVDLEGATINGVNFTVNAGSLDIDLSRVAALGAGANGTVNAGSATIALPDDPNDYGFSMNAGSLNVCVPRDAALRVHWTGALGSNDLDDLDLVRVDASTWTTREFDESLGHIELRVSANAGGFQLEMGGDCSA
jgi:hypothetical protein